jgi:cysteinyl-tRNA synthetase
MPSTSYEVDYVMNYTDINDKVHTSVSTVPNTFVTADEPILTITGEQSSTHS